MRLLAYCARGKAAAANSGRLVLLLTAANTRTDDWLRQMGQACEGFDVVLAAVKTERRGRESQEVPALLAAGVRSLGEQAPAVIEAEVETEAIACLAELHQPGDFCVVCSFATELMREKLLHALCAS